MSVFIFWKKRKECGICNTHMIYKCTLHCNHQICTSCYSKMLFTNFNNNIESKCPFCRAIPCSDFPVLQVPNIENQNINYNENIDSDEELNNNDQIVQIIHNLRNQRTALRRVTTELNQIFLYDTIVKIKTIMVIMLVLIVCTVILIEEVNKKIND